MSAIYLAGLLLAAPATPNAERYPLVAPPPVLMPDEVPTATELRKACDEAIRQSYRAGVSDTVPELVKVFRLLDRDKQLKNADREQLRQRTRTRLLAMGDKIVSDAKRERARQRQADAAAKRGVREALVAPPVSTASAISSGKPSDYAVASEASQSPGAAGGGAIGEEQGEALVELIRSTIAPATWDVAGGPGRIVYYAQWQALVVHQTEEVHWMIGGMRAALGK